MGSPILVLDDSESVLRPTLEDGAVTSIMVDCSSDDGPQIIEDVGNALEAAGLTELDEELA